MNCFFKFHLKIKTPYNVPDCDTLLFHESSYAPLFK